MVAYISIFPTTFWISLQTLPSPHRVIYGEILVSFALFGFIWGFKLCSPLLLLLTSNSHIKCDFSYKEGHLLICVIGGEILVYFVLFGFLWGFKLCFPLLLLLPSNSLPLTSNSHIWSFLPHRVLEILLELGDFHM